MTKRVINIAEIELLHRPAALAAPAPTKVRFEGRHGSVGTRIGAQRLGYNITAVPPGARAFPFHNHRVNEEMFFVLEGSGELRFGDERHAIRQGDFVACPPGGPETAHQIINTGTTELKYLAVSTMDYPEICDYPDSGKFLVAERARAADGTVCGFRHVGRADDALDYWDGE
jgi:uncharacterized cupin superfamily protein